MARDTTGSVTNSVIVALCANLVEGANVFTAFFSKITQKL
jgi:hypothetical protein